MSLRPVSVVMARFLSMLLSTTLDSGNHVRLYQMTESAGVRVGKLPATSMAT